MCDSVHGRVSASVHAGIPPPPVGTDTPRSRHPPEQTPLEQDTPQEQTPQEQTAPPVSRHPPGADTPHEQTPPPGADTPPGSRYQPGSRLPPGEEHATRYGQRARRYASYWNAILLVHDFAGIGHGALLFLSFCIIHCHVTA